MLKRPATGATLTVRYDRDRIVAASARDTVSSALLGAGIVATSRSIKFRRPRGPFCLRGDCGTCLVRINGEPNRRACMTPVTHGIAVDPQNRVLATRGPDPSALADTFFGRTMDHHHFMVHPRLANQVMQGVARNLAGLGRLPDRVAEPSAAPSHHAPDVLVVGAGPAAMALVSALHGTAAQIEVVDRLDPLALPVATSSHARIHARTGVFGVYPAEGVVAAITSADRTPGRLQLFAPRHLVLAVGATDSMPALENNDLPGVVAARGLAALLRRCGTEPSRPVLVIGSGESAKAAADALAAELIDPSDVRALVGKKRVEAIATTRGELPAELVAIAGTPAPAYPLAVQAGAHTRFADSGFAVVRDGQGRCASSGPFTVWACGDVTGYLGHAAAQRDGARVGEALAAVLRTETANRSAR